MALNRDQLIELSKASAKAALNPSTTFSLEGATLSADAITKTFVNELNELGKEKVDIVKYSTPRFLIHVDFPDPGIPLSTNNNFILSSFK